MSKGFLNYKFTLFHHDVIQKKHAFSVSTEEIKSMKGVMDSFSTQDLANTIYQIVIHSLERVEGLQDNQVSITLTGGMDSRVILACLLKAGVKPNCFTFGSEQAKDVFFAKKLAQAFGLSYQNAANRQPDKEWYYHWVKKVIRTDGGNAHLHRAHRLAAVSEHCEVCSPKILFTGHMGGEGIRGLTYNNYFASRFFEEVNEGKKGIRESAEGVLYDYFIRQESIDWEELIQEICALPYMQADRKMNKFYFLYNMVANIHHAQDLRLYNSKVEHVIPVFLQQEYLNILFASEFNFLNKPRGLAGKLSNPKVHTALIDAIYPDLLDYPLSNGYKPREYQKGLWYMVPATLYRKTMQKKQFEPTFSYGNWYVEFVKEHAENISDQIWEVYDKDRYMKALYKREHRTDEGYWHKFSNPIFFDLVEKYKSGGL